MTQQRTMKRVAMVFAGLVGALLLRLAIYSVRMVTFEHFVWSAAGAVHFAVNLVLAVGALALALLLMACIRKGDTPFARKNIRLLKGVALLLMVVEPYNFLATRFLIQNLTPVWLENGMRVEVHNSLDGVVLAAGLVVYCVALIFQYGMSLQVQVDETL